MSPLPVQRCVCFDVTFERMKRHVERCGGGLDEIQRQFSCGRGCGLCIPYIRLMLATGRTAFAVGEGDQMNPAAGPDPEDPPGGHSC